MKKALIITLLAFICLNTFAQKFEVIKEYKFDDTFSYYESWYDDIGYHGPGISSIISTNEEMYIYCYSSLKWINVNQDDDIDCFTPDGGLYKLNGGLYFLVNGSIKIYLNNFEYNKPDYVLSVDESFDLKDYHSIYLTENMVFAQTSDNKLVSWGLLGNGKSEYHGKDETQKLLNDGLAEKLGYHEKSGDIWFGENCVSLDNPPAYSRNVTVEIMDKNYSEYSYRQYMKGSRFLGNDKRGLSYFFFLNEPGKFLGQYLKENISLTVSILCFDNFENKIYRIQLPSGDWNPARNEKGLIAACSQCIDQEGNIYFTDCNKEKGCYEIKKLSNDWLKQYEFYGREIGRVKENHIPLKQEADESAQDNGYNFEHEYLWILDHGEEWSKVRKVDGREGYVMNKYIEFNQS